MNVERWVQWASCGCAGRRDESGTSDTTDTSPRSPTWPPPFDQWSFRAATTPPASVRGLPLTPESFASSESANSRTPLRVPLPTTPGSETSRWSPETDAPVTFARQVRHSASQVLSQVRRQASAFLRAARRP